MKNSWIEKILQNEDTFRKLQQERLILEVTELICEVMNKTNVTRTELARRLKKTKSLVSQLLDGEANMTLRTLSDILTAMGRSLHLSDVPLSREIGEGSFKQDMSIADWNNDHCPISPWDSISKPSSRMTNTASNSSKLVG